MRAFIEPIIQKCHPVCNANEKFLNRIRRTITVARRAFVHTTAKFFRSSRFRDGCTLLRSPKKAFCKKTRSLHPSDVVQGFGLCPTSSCKARGFVYTKTLLARELRRTRMVPRSTACRSYCIHLNCQFRSQLLYWAYQSFFGRTPQ